MKKHLIFILVGLILAGISLGTFFIVKRYYDNLAFSLEVITSDGGFVDVTINESVEKVPSNESASYTVKNNTSVTFESTANNGYKFIGWFVDGVSCGTESTLTLEITDSTVVAASFEEQSVVLTINDSKNQNFNETFNFTLKNNLLEYLNSKYSAPRGYVYKFFCNNQPVTSSTTLTEDATIIRTKEIVTYTVTYKLPEGYTFDDGSNTKDVNYTIEDESFAMPSLPTANKHYSLAWNKTINETNFDTTTSVEAIESEIQYPVTFKLSTGTFDGTNSSIIKNLSISDVSYPTTPTPEQHYEYIWNVTINEDNLDSVTEVIANLSAIEYTVTYKLPDGYTFDDTNSNTKDVVYTIEDENFVSPEFPETEHFTLSWDNTITKENLGTIDLITASESGNIYTVTFKHNNETVAEVKYFSSNPVLEGIPPFPTADSTYAYIWEDYSEKLENMGNFEVNSKPLAIIHISTVFENDLTASDMNTIYHQICYNNDTDTVYFVGQTTDEIGTLKEFAEMLSEAGKENVVLTKINQTSINNDNIVNVLTGAIGNGTTITLTYSIDITD